MLRQAGFLQAEVLPYFRSNRLRRAAPLAIACALRSSRVPALPLRLAIEPSTHCPLDCASCARAEQGREPRDMTPAVFEAILAQVRPRIVHLHGGGEPFAHPQLPRMCADARRTGARVAVLTSLTDAESIERAVASLPVLDRLHVGVDAVTQAVYERVRGGGDLDRVYAGVRALVRERAVRGGTHPAIILTFLLLERNIHEAVPFVRAAFAAGADGVTFLPVDLFGIESRTGDLVGRLRGKDVAEVVSHAARAAAQIGIRTNAELLLDLPIALDHSYGGTPLPGMLRCLRPWFSTFVTVDGYARPCSRFAYDASANLGNLTEVPFPSIWNGPAYRAVRAGMRGLKPVHELCARCPGPYEEGGLLGNLRRRRRSP
jgi:MoaA/NifB/PqqE/SkfB family radical SAM enzyme